MDVAWTQMGQCEVSGNAANPRIIEYFKGVGRGDVVSDEVSWCAAFTGWCLKEGGVSIDAIPSDNRLLARSYLKFGTPIDKPRVGAIAVFSRGSDPVHGHVGFVTGETDDAIVLLGGNQSNKVCTVHIAKSRLLGLRWPGQPATAGQLAAAGSRTIVRATRIQVDTGKVSATQLFPQPPALPPADAIVAKGTALQGSIESALSLATFARDRWPWIMAGVAGYYCLRMAWDAIAVKQARVEDHNTGGNVLRQTASEDPAAGEEGP